MKYQHSAEINCNFVLETLAKSRLESERNSSNRSSSLCSVHQIKNVRARIRYTSRYLMSYVYRIACEGNITLRIAVGLRPVTCPYTLVTRSIPRLNVILYSVRPGALDIRMYHACTVFKYNFSLGRIEKAGLA